MREPISASTPAMEAAPSPEMAVRIAGLSHTYLPGTSRAVAALRDAALTVRRGEIVALVGPGGAGKSTLVHFLDGLLRPAEPGRVWVLGADTGDPACDLAALRRRVGLVFQYPHHQIIEPLAGDDVAYGPRQLGLPREALRARVQWAMEAVGLDFEAFVDRPSFGLSGGEMRRLVLAGALAMEPEILVLDEATSGLDPRGRREILALLRRLRDERGTTVLLVSNDMDEVAAVADQVAVLVEGRTVFQGPPAALFAPGAPDYGLAPPAAAEIAAALRAAGWDLPPALTLEDVEEAVWRALPH